MLDTDISEVGPMFIIRLISLLFVLFLSLQTFSLPKTVDVYSSVTCYSIPIEYPIKQPIVPKKEYKVITLTRGIMRTLISRGIAKGRVADNVQISFIPTNKDLPIRAGCSLLRDHDNNMVIMAGAILKSGTCYVRHDRAKGLCKGYSAYSLGIRGKYCRLVFIKKGRELRSTMTLTTGKF